MQSGFQVADMMYPKMVGGYNHKSIFVDEMEAEELGMSSAVNEFEDRVFGNTVNEGYIPAFLEDYDHNYVTKEGDESFEGMIFMSNRQTKKECFNRQLFGLPMSQASVVKLVKPGMKLFLFEYERRQLYGVFEATSCGALNIERDAFKTSGGSFPAQVCYRHSIKSVLRSSCLVAEVVLVIRMVFCRGCIGVAADLIILTSSRFGLKLFGNVILFQKRISRMRFIKIISLQRSLIFICHRSRC